ncbi:MAG: hypothetical protein GY936_18485 [Ignavibacteriae bacterium]|nr:hypothetical protein [Ignavibacteriota bacterium]
MIAEEFYYSQYPSSSINKGITISYILKTIKKSSTYFIESLDNRKTIKPLNEDELTQILVEQINALLRDDGTSISVLTKYHDITFGSKGFPDFYFHNIEKGQINAPLFIVESKRLPAPLPKTREKEYVIGDNKNGGIERFKLEIHGKGQVECGLIGFIEKEDFDFWKDKVNSWILDLVNTGTSWEKDEELSEKENNNNYAYLYSIAHRIKSIDLILHHLWICTPT